MRLAHLATLGLLACAGPKAAAPPAPPRAVSAVVATPRATTDRTLLVAGSHAIRDARWVDHRIVARSERELWFVDPEHPDTTHLFETPAPMKELVTQSESPLSTVRLDDEQVLVFLRGALVHRFSLETRSRIESLSPDGRWLLKVTSQAEATVLDARTGAEISSFEHEEGTVVFDRTGTYLLRTGSVVRVADGVVVKTWRTSEAAQFAPRGWIGERAIIFHDKGVRIVDPVASTVKEVPFECKRNAAAHDVFAPTQGIVMHVCGERAMRIDPATGGITRVKLPVATSFTALESRVLADGTVSFIGNQPDGRDFVTRVAVTLDPARGTATAIDRESWSAEATEPSFEDRDCTRLIGKALPRDPWCAAERDGSFYIAVRGGSLGIANAEGEIARFGAHAPGTPWTPYRLVGGAGLGGLLESPDADGTQPGLRWKLGAPSESGTRKLDVTGRRCGLGTELPGGHVLAMCEAAAGSPTSATPERRKPKKGGSMSVLVELSASLEVVAERSLPDAGEVVVANGHPVTWMPRATSPFVATEWPGPPSVCGADCAPLATFQVYRDFAVRIDAGRKVQIAGTLDPHTFVCVDAEGGVRPYETCPADAKLME